MAQTNIRRKTTRLVVAAIGVMAICLLAAIFVNVWEMRFNTIGQRQKQDADIFSGFISQQIENEVNTIKAYLGSPWWCDAVMEANLRYLNWGPEAVKQHMAAMDEQWAAAGDGRFVRDLLASRMSRRLQALAVQDSVIAEIFLTDQYGGLVASSAKTSDFYQADEDWWQRAYNNGAGDVFFGEVELDESSGKISCPIAVPVKDEAGRIIGISKTVLDIPVFFRPLMRYRFGRTGYVELLDHRGGVIYHPVLKPMSRAEISAAELSRVLESRKGFRLESGASFRRRPLVSASGITSPTLRANGIRWAVVVAQDEWEIFAPLFTIFGMGLVLTLGAAVLIILIMRRVIAGIFIIPLRKIQDGMRRFSEGETDCRIDLRTGDEIEDLAGAFNSMIGRLEKTTISRDYLDNVIGSITDSLIVVDPDLKITSANKAACALSGYEADELSGKEMGFLFPQEKAAFRALLAEGVLSDREAYFRAADARLIPVILSGAVLKRKDRHGEKVLGAVFAAKDISELKKAHEKLSRSLQDELRSRQIMTSMLEDNSEVRGKLERSLKTLQEAQARLLHAGKMEAVGRMASGIAHEVKNPLGIILQGVNYFEGKLPPDAKDHREVLQMMRDGVQRADRIVRALLDFSRDQEFSLEPQDINAVIEDSINLVRHRLKLGSVEHLCELGHDLPPVHIDRGKIEQVLVNLFNNAADAMPGGGKLYIRSYLEELKEPRNKVGNREDDVFRPGESAVIVEVEDTGTGIAADIIDKVFDPFFTTKNRAEGTGLGLSVTRGILQMHQGWIDVVSAPGKGSKFTIVFKISGKGRS